jgi:hypothetical protein
MDVLERAHGAGAERLRVPTRVLGRRERRADRRTHRALKRAGYSDHIGADLARELVAPLEGGATGAGGGVTFLSNLPADNFVMSPQAFQQATERQDIPQQTLPFGGFGTNLQVRLQNVGVLSMVRFLFSGSLVVTTPTGTVTSLPGWPYTLLKRTAFNANGQTSIIGANGATLRARRQRLFRNPAEVIETAAGAIGTIAAGTYPINFVVDVPISHDMLTGTGWVLAQNPATSLTLDIAFAQVAELLSITGTATAALTGTCFTTITTFAVGQVNDGGRLKTLIPDLTVFHGILDNDLPLPGNGVFQAPLIRPAGQLVNYAFNINNGGSAEVDPSALTEIQFRYGGNRQPRVYNPPQMLIEKNQADYNGPVKVRGLTYTYLDFEADNPARDLFIPEALVELLAQVTIPTGVTINAGAKFRYELENLYPAV